MVYGALLAFQPDRFRRFHDFLNPGSRWNTGGMEKEY
jgi:hypothetical protein